MGAGGMITTGMHEANLVVLSILIAVFASFTALSLAGRVRAGQGAARRCGWWRRPWRWAVASGRCISWPCWPFACRAWTWAMTWG
ncbi:MHYT domain-containing protein [Novosphingobium pokkalii]|uniref:MHYT domain-containing protein n=1 Tax=Novosphingobium pokkalii TaxID=1770194 RepID=UPI0036257144